MSRYLDEILGSVGIGRGEPCDQRFVDSGVLVCPLWIEYVCKTGARVLQRAAETYELLRDRESFRTA